MKLFFLTVIFITGLFATNAVEAAKDLGVEKAYTQALEKARKEDKIVVMVVVKENCRWCDKIVKQTLSDETVHNELKKFVTVIVDKDAPFPSDFKAGFFPSIFYIDHKTQKSIYENVGYVDTKSFLNDLHDAQRIRALQSQKK
jgi:thioredoxin-related protein